MKKTILLLIALTISLTFLFEWSEKIELTTSVRSVLYQPPKDQPSQVSLTRTKENEDIQNNSWLPNPDKALRPQLAVYAESEPLRAAEIALGYPPDKGDEDNAIVNDPVGIVMLVWAKTDPDKAIEFYNTIQDPERKRGAAIGVAEGLAIHDPELAGKWVRTEIEKNNQDQVVLISVVIPYMKPQKAQAWLDSLPLDEENRALTNGLVSARPQFIP